MKMLILILWSAGLVHCDKLDRTYLPPPGSISAGGYHEDLNLPLEYPRENHPSTLDPGNDRITDEILSSPNYPNIALGIDRQVPSISASAESYTTGPGFSVSTNIYSVPSTTSSYAFTQTTTALPVRVESYAGIVPVTTISEGSPLDPKLNYDQYLIQQIIDPNILQQLNENTDQLLPGSRFGNPKIPNSQEVLQNPSIDSDDNMYMLSRQNNVDGIEPKLLNFNNIISINRTSQNSAKQPSVQYGSDLDNISTVSIPVENISNPVKFDQQGTFGVHSMQINPENNDSENKETQKFYNPLKTTPSPTLIASEIKEATSGGPITAHNDNFITSSNSNVQPQIIQADTDRNAVVLDYRNILTPEGFAYSFDTSNGIHVDESGTANNGVQAKGSYSFTGDDGKVYKIEYTADENGFLPRGDHLPTAPPIPDVILRGIQQAEKNRQMGIFDDGSYDDAKYGHAKYQGIIGQIPQNRYTNFIINKASNRERIPNTVQSSIKEVERPENYGKHEIDVISQSPNNFKIVENNNEDLFEVDDEKYDEPRLIDGNQSNSLRSDKLQNLNISDKFGNGSKNKFREDAMNSDSRLTNENKRPLYNNSDIIAQGSYSVDDNQHLHTGYEYIKPQKMIYDDTQNSLQSRFSNANEDNTSNLNDETQSKRITPKPFITSNVSFNFDKQKANPNTELLRTNLNEPFETSTIIDNIEKQNGNAGKTFEEKIPDQIKTNDYSVSDPEFINSKPKYSSTATPNYYQTKSYKDGNENNNNPSSSLVSEYTTSTTPMPSAISDVNPGTSNLIYPVTAPTASQIISTLRPSSASGPEEISLRPGLTENLRNDNPRIRITKPTTSSQRISGKSGYRNRPDDASIQDDVSKHLKTRFGVSTEPSSQDTRFSTLPEDFSRPSLIEKAIGEDFSGPKQPQRFDPERGYFY